MEEASKGIQRLGGIDLDTAFAAAVRGNVPSGSSLDPFDLERAKVVLSSQESTVVPLVGGGTLELTRAVFEDAIRPLIVKTKEPIERCLSDISAPKVDHLVLVGGSSKIPVVQRYVREMLRLDPLVGVDPMTAVAEGASIAAGILSGKITEYDFYVGTEHALGTVVNNDSSGPQFSVLIARNTKLPASATDAYSPVFDDQEQVRVRVIEGDPDQAFDHEDNVILKEWDVELPEKRPAAEAGFTITFEYDVDGILHVLVVDQKTGTTMMDEQLAFGAAQSKQDLVEIRRRIDGASIAADSKVDDAATRSLSPAAQSAIKKAREKIHPFVDPDTQQRLDDQIAALSAAEAGSEAEALTALERTIREHAYLL
jgi:molecular chaperone DnaK (HSP70)